MSEMFQWKKTLLVISWSWKGFKTSSKIQPLNHLIVSLGRGFDSRTRQFFLANSFLERLAFIIPTLFFFGWIIIMTLAFKVPLLFFLFYLGLSQFYLGSAFIALMLSLYIPLFWASSKLFLSYLLKPCLSTLTLKILQYNRVCRTPNPQNFVPANCRNFHPKLLASVAKNCTRFYFLLFAKKAPWKICPNILDITIMYLDLYRYSKM